MVSPSARSAGASRNFTTGRGCDGATSTRAAPDAIAKELGCHRGTLVKALHRSRITLRAPVRFPQLGDRAWLRRRYVIEGKTLRAIATEVGCQPSTVAQALRRARIEPRRRRRPSPSRLRTDWQRYGTINSVAALHEVSPARAELWLAELGILSPHVRHLPRNELRALVRRVRRRQRSPIVSE